MRLRTVIVNIVMLVGATALGSGLAVVMHRPASPPPPQPVLAPVAALPAVRGTSVVVVPTVITLSALRGAFEGQVPHDLNGKRDFPSSRWLSHAEIGWAVTRGPLAVYGKPELVAITAALQGTLRATGQISSDAASRIGNALNGLLGEGASRNIQKLGGRSLDQRADMRGSIAVIAKPMLTPAWRVEPNLTAQISVPEIHMSISGARINVGNQVKPQLDRQINEQVAALQERVRNDPSFEQAARRQWSELCRSFSLGATGAGLPELWLELRPTRALAAQPRIDGETVTLLLGVEAETRIIPTATKPDCPFPAMLSIVPQTEAARVTVAMPVDVPFTEVNRLITARLVGKTFPADTSGPATVKVNSASISPSGDRLLISLQVHATERRSWFGLGTDATVHIWGRPVLDSKNQVFQLADVSLAVESQGVLGTAATAVAPYLERAVADNAVIDLKPMLTNARKSIEAAIAGFRNGGEGVRVDAVVNDLRVVGIAFDSTTLRIAAEADGAAKVSVSALPR